MSRVFTGTELIYSVALAKGLTIGRHLERDRTHTLFLIEPLDEVLGVLRERVLPVGVVRTDEELDTLIQNRDRPVGFTFDSECDRAVAVEVLVIVMATLVSERDVFLSNFDFHATNKSTDVEAKCKN